MNKILLLILLETKINALDKLIKSDSKDEKLILERKQLKDELDSKFADKPKGPKLDQKLNLLRRENDQHHTF